MLPHQLHKGIFGSMSKNISKSVLGFVAVRIPLTILTFCLYGVLIGISLLPSLWLVLILWKRYPPLLSGANLALCSLSLGLALFVYFLTGALTMGVCIRLLSWGIKPGCYAMYSFTMFRWLLYSGIYHIAGMTILAYVPMSFINEYFFRLVGAKIGKNCALNTWLLNDAYLLDIGDNVIIGGKTDISCHTFEKGCLILSPVKIGSNTLIGQNCYISPGVSVGAHATIGQYAFIRKNKKIADHSIYSALGGLPIRTITKLGRCMQ
jgi:acetyltransferase-like isoleucine patch superfamily enzyme